LAKRKKIGCHEGPVVIQVCLLQDKLRASHQQQE
jgi:hypothetical protein